MVIHKPSIIAFLETHNSGNRTDAVCSKIGFRGQYRVEAQGSWRGLGPVGGGNCASISH